MRRRWPSPKTQEPRGDGTLRGCEEAAAALAEDERLMRARHEGSIAPLRAALKEKEEALKEAEDEQLGAQLLAERLAVADAQHVADEEFVGAGGAEGGRRRGARRQRRGAARGAEHRARPPRRARRRDQALPQRGERGARVAARRAAARRAPRARRPPSSRSSATRRRARAEGARPASPRAFSRHREAAAVGAAIETSGSADGDGGAAAAIATAGAAAAAARGSASARARRRSRRRRPSSSHWRRRRRRRCASSARARRRARGDHQGAPRHGGAAAAVGRGRQVALPLDRVAGQDAAQPPAQPRERARRRAVRRGRRAQRDVPVEEWPSYVHLAGSSGAARAGRAPPTMRTVKKSNSTRTLFPSVADQPYTPDDPSLYADRARLTSSRYLMMLVLKAQPAPRIQKWQMIEMTPHAMAKPPAIWPVDDVELAVISRRSDEEEQRARAERVVQDQK